MEEMKPDDGSNVTPEEQAMYDQVISIARKTVFGDKDDDTRFKMVLQRLGASKDALPEAIGGIASVVMANISGAAEKKKREVPGYILFHAGDELVDDLLEIAVAGKLVDEGKREEVKKAALFEGLRLYGQNEMDAGKITPDKQQAAKAELQELQGKRGIIESARS